MDVNPQIQLERIRDIAPLVSRIGVPCSDRSALTVRLLQEEAATHQLTVVAVRSEQDRFAATLEQLDAENCDAALMLPDAAVYNSPNVQAMLLWGLRGQKPVWGFSENIMRAGALAALIPDERATARQIMDIVDRITGAARPEDIPVQFGNTAVLAFNERTADLIGLRLDPDQLGQTAILYPKRN